MNKVTSFADPDTSQEIKLERLAAVTIDLIDAHRDLAQLLSSETRTKIEAFVTSISDTVTRSKLQAEAAAVDITVEIFKVKGDIAALEEERNYLCLALELGRKDGNGENSSHNADSRSRTS